MVLATGSLPPRNLPPYPPGSSPSHEHVRVQVYAQRNVLNKISTVYDGEVWPELGQWATRTIPPKNPEPSAGLSGIKDRLVGLLDAVTQTQSKEESEKDTLRGVIQSGSESKARGAMYKPAREAYPLLEGIGIQYCP